MRLYTVVLHYGDPAMTRDLVKVLEADGDNVHVIDNASPDSYKAGPYVERLEHNVFWAGALGVALERARAAGATHLWFCNNDIRFISPAPHIRRVTARITRMEERLGKTPGVYAPAVTRNPYHAQMVARRDVEYTRVAYVDGIAPVVSLDCVEEIGGLDAGGNLRGYGVDVWLSHRASQAGWPVVVDHGVVVRHDYHTTAKQVPGFLADAAVSEENYMTERMGKKWRERLGDLQCEQHHEAKL